ncbi:DsbA family protein [Hoeflea sp. WL0058]|uniref:DsbA family protein n=1 Tax=Flavimaribacter sediminis TaxID=2865987 RepID=A0AAE2ZSH6_9HYPH|nr:DsbA family protein [Flavimaribacter sediminis]MBW8640122.1 DsbA family protein [Flavimaribacter sediminis]
MSSNANTVVRNMTKLAGATALAIALAACSDSGGNKTAETMAPATSTSQMSADNSITTGAISDGETKQTSAASSAEETVQVAQASTSSSVDLPSSDGSVDMDAVLEPGPMEEMYLGDADAPVKIVEYMSMTCPHCAAFHNNTFKPIIEKYADSGKIQFIVREFPFDPRATAAIMLARCAPDDKFFPMVEVLMQQQQNWARAQDARTALLNIAKLAGFTQETFEACLTNQQLVDDVNTVKNKAVQEFGVTSTPTFLINGNRYSGNMSVDQMSALIDSML